MDFYTKQLQNEINYIENNYLSQIKEKNDKIKKVGDFIVIKIFLNNIPYTMYKKDSKEFNILLVPDKILFNNDFDKIISYRKTNKEIHFSCISKKQRFIDLFKYNFYFNEDGYSTGNYFCDNFFDEKNILNIKLNESKKNIHNFLFDLNIKSLNHEGYRLERIKRNKNSTKINKINEVSLLKAYQLYDCKFNEIDNNESPFLEIFENLYKNQEKTRS